MSEQENGFTTHDLGFAAYLKLREFSLRTANRGDKGLFNFVFDDPNKAANALRVEYINSDFAKFDAELKSLKKLINVT